MINEFPRNIFSEETEVRRGFDPQMPARDRACLFGDI